MLLWVFIRSSTWSFLAAATVPWRLEYLKICNSYLYLSDITDAFNELFEYYKDGTKVIITSIKKVNDNIRKYLSKTIPIYIKTKGFNIKGNYEFIEDLPDEVNEYISFIESLTSLKVNNVSIGPERSMKLERKKLWIY